MEPKGGPGGVRMATGREVGCGALLGSNFGGIWGAQGGQMGAKWVSNGGQMATNIASRIGVDLEVHFGGLSLCELLVLL